MKSKSSVSSLCHNRFILRIVMILAFLTATTFGFSQQYDFLINDNRVNLRDSPSTTGNIIVQLNLKQKVQAFEKPTRYELIDGVKSFWFKVKLEDGRTGYCFGRFLDISGSVNRMFENIVYDSVNHRYRSENISRVSQDFKKSDLVGVWVFGVYVYQFFPDGTYSEVFGSTHEEALGQNTNIKSLNHYGRYDYKNSTLMLFDSISISEQKMNSEMSSGEYFQNLIRVPMSKYSGSVEYILLDYGGDGKGFKLW